MSNYLGKDCDCTYHCEKCDPTWKDKGKKDGRCNITACDGTDEIIFFNHAMSAYYCGLHAEGINSANKVDAIRLYGHELCLTDDKQTPIEYYNTIIDGKRIERKCRG